MTNEETNERYWIEITNGAVFVRDDETGGILAFTGPDRLLTATAEMNRLQAFDGGEGGNAKPVTPAAFLAETLPAVAKRQRLESHLAEVKAIATTLRASLAEDMADLVRAIVLQEKVENELKTALSATQSGQNGSGVGRDTLSDLKAREASWSANGQPPIGYRASLSKPGPY